MCLELDYFQLCCEQKLILYLFHQSHLFLSLLNVSQLWIDNLITCPGSVSTHFTQQMAPNLSPRRKQIFCQFCGKQFFGKSTAKKMTQQLRKLWKGFWIILLLRNKKCLKKEDKLLKVIISKKMFYFSMITVKFFVKCSSFKNVEKIRIVILFEPCWQKWSRFYSWKSISKNWTSLNGFKSQSKAV